MVEFVVFLTAEIGGMTRDTQTLCQLYHWDSPCPVEMNMHPNIPSMLTLK